MVTTLGLGLRRLDDPVKRLRSRQSLPADLADLRGIEVTAHQLQHFVDKECDLRVVVVGEQIFAVAIHPTSPAARIDFRADYRALRHELVELPTVVETGVRTLMAELGLVFGCLDFAAHPASAESGRSAA